MANIIPDEIKNIDEADLPGKVKTIYDYVKYMREMLEFWSSNVNRGTGLAAEGMRKISQKEVRTVDGKVKKLSLDLDATEEEVHSIIAEIWDNGDQRYASRITQNADQIETAVDAIWPNGTSSSSQFTQLANQISTKVSDTDLTGNLIASRINQTATTVSIQASKINLNGAVTANNYFKIKTDGSIEAISGKIGGWTLSSNKLTSGTLGSNSSFHMGTANLGTATIAGTSLSTWRLGIGSGFGVTNDGTLYTNKAQITGGQIDLSTTTLDDALFRVIYEEKNNHLARRVCAIRPYHFQSLAYGNRIRVQIGLGRSEFFDTNYSSTVPKARFGLSIPDVSSVTAVGTSYGSFSLSNASGASKISGAANTGTLTCVSLTQTSDRRYKKDIADLDETDASEFIYSLRPVSFRFTDTDEKLHHGFIAQDVEAVAEYDLVQDTESGKALNYIEMIADVVATLQEQNERIKQLEEK